MVSCESGVSVPEGAENAFRAPDGKVAVVMVNASTDPQEEILFWKSKQLNLNLKPSEILIKK